MRLGPTADLHEKHIAAEDRDDVLSLRIHHRPPVVDGTILADDRFREQPLEANEIASRRRVRVELETDDGVTAEGLGDAAKGVGAAAMLAALVCHNDAGSQYTSVAHTDAVAALDARASIGTVGDSFDNAMAKSVNALYKTELHRNPAVLADNGGHWKGLDDLEIATSGWVRWFNEGRIHDELDDATPAEVEAAHYRHLGQANAA